MCSQVLEEGVLSVPSPRAELHQALTSARLRAHKEECEGRCEATLGPERFDDVLAKSMRMLGSNSSNTQGVENFSKEQVLALKREADRLDKTQKGAAFEFRGEYQAAIDIYKSQANDGCTTAMSALAALYLLGKLDTPS